jgi:hypothetical protein
MVLNIYFTNKTPFPTRVVGTGITLQPNIRVDLLTFLSMEDMINLYGLGSMIDSGTVSVNIITDTQSLNISDSATFNNFLVAQSGNTPTPPPGPGVTQNVVYVDGVNGNDKTGNGSATKPFKTINKGCAAIGDASSAGDFNNPATNAWMLILATGVYNENVVLPVRQVIQIGVEAVTINGNITQSVDPAKYYGGLINETKIILKGLDLDGAGPLVPPSIINGNIELNSSGGIVMSVQAMYCLINGNVVFNSQGDPFEGKVCLEGTDVSGNIQANGGPVSLYAVNAANLPPNTINGVNGNVGLLQLSNVEFDGPVVTSSQLGGHWTGVIFDPILAHDFSQAGGIVICDTNSANSFTANIQLKGQVQIRLADNAEVIFYTPLRPTDWTPAPYTTRDALDQLARRLKNLGG